MRLLISTVNLVLSVECSHTSNEWFHLQVSLISYSTFSIFSLDNLNFDILTITKFYFVDLNHAHEFKCNAIRISLASNISKLKITIFEIYSHLLSLVHFPREWNVMLKILNLSGGSKYQIYNMTVNFVFTARWQIHNLQNDRNSILTYWIVST